MQIFRHGAVSGLVGLLFAAPSFAYYSATAVEAELEFEGRIVAGSESRIPYQVRHLIGLYQAEGFRAGELGFPYAGALHEKFEIRLTGIEPETGHLTYRFRGHMIVESRAFQGRKERLIPIVLPLDPDRIHAQSSLHPRYRNPCTSPDFNGAEEFWYFWDPTRERCGLLGRSELLLETRGRIKKIPNTRRTFPEYDRLFGDNENGELFEASVFFGYLERTNRRDDAARAYRQFNQWMAQTGFRLVESHAGFREYRDGRKFRGINYLSVWENDADARRPMRVQVLLTDTDPGTKDRTFQQYWARALERSDVVIYDGHSSLGTVFDYPEFEKIAFSPTKYQIYFFNGCGTYPFYQQSFLSKKGGSQNLEVITTGLETDGPASAPNAIALLESFLEGATPSYQVLLRKLERSSEPFSPYLLGVSGDEDNQWAPEKP